MRYALYVLLALLIAQGIFSLVEGVRFRNYIRRWFRRPPNTHLPKAVIIAPSKGLDLNLEENLRALFRLDYPDYEIVLAIASKDDPSRVFVERAISEHPRRSARLIVAGLNSGRSEKVNNLIRALEHAPPDAEAVAFVDLDAGVEPDWLRNLVGPLGDSRVGAATGYRWYLPERGGFWPALLSAWNGSVATTLGDHGNNFAWGGSTAILRETFDRIGVRRRWEGAVSDDYALTRSVKEAGLRVEFVPGCLVISRDNSTLRALLEFTTRQMTITRVYRPNVWWTALVSQVLFNAGFLGGIGFVLARMGRGESFALPLILIIVIYFLGSMKGWLRLASAAEALPENGKEIRSLWWMFCLLWPLVAILFLYNIVRSSMTRRIEWRGVVYEMRSPSDTRRAAD